MRKSSRAYRAGVDSARAPPRTAGAPNLNRRAWSSYLGRYRAGRNGLFLSAGCSSPGALLVLSQAYLVKLAFTGMTAKSGWSAVILRARASSSCDASREACRWRRAGCL
jgi:hypothetical protein